MHKNHTNPIPFLMYHEIREDGDPYSVSESDFRLHMKYLYDHNFHTITLRDFYQHRRENVLLPSKIIVITFDDGYANNFTKAFPILANYDFRATFFITTNLIKIQRGLSEQQICELNNAGMCIGSHTKTHRFLSALNTEEIRSELADSKKILEDIIESKVEHLSLPGGRSKKRSQQIAEEVGYKTICTSRVGCNNLNSDIFRLCRIPIKKSINMESFTKIVSGDENYFHKLQKMSRLKNMGKLMLGNKLYHSFWKIFHSNSG